MYPFLKYRPCVDNYGFGPKGFYNANPKRGKGGSTYGHLFEKKFEYTSSLYDNAEKEERVVLQYDLTVTQFN